MHTKQIENKQTMAQVKDEPITEDNIRFRAERIAVYAMKTHIGYASNPYTRIMFCRLLDDLNNFNNPRYVISDSYEMVHEAVMFLCGYMGKRTTDLIIDKRGEPVTILRACFRVIHRFVQSKLRKSYRARYIEDMPEHCFRNEFEFEVEREPEDYTAVNEKIKAMNLTERQSIVLDYRMTGCNYTDIGRIMFENNKRKTAADKVRNTVLQIREKYTRLFIEHKPLKTPFRPDDIFIQADMSELKLTPTQNKVIQCYLRGERISEIARAFSISRQAAFAAVQRVRNKIKAQTDNTEIAYAF